ncbi:DUF6114 domain-containing protein [Streptomyces sp. NPDC023327]|uniref:DUF6114 domain-containing protein n=1 Tax=Streptomyces sp. NPDC023327 TaxID=3157088 RepID=UPI00340EDAC3
MRVRRGHRPRGAIVCVAAAGAEIGYFPLAQVGLLPVQGVSGAATVMLALALVGCAVHLWTAPARARFSGAAAIALGVLSYPFANLGGFLLGMLLALVGGALAVAWRPASLQAAGDGG